MTATKPTAADLTLAELATALAHVLAVDYEGVRSGRVRDLPDARTIRWYQTLGIVDRPAAFRGRTALFGRRHLLQLAAIKRLQATGLPLADIQRGLAGGTDAELARAAGLRIGDVDRGIAGVIEARKAAAESTLAAALAPAPGVTRPAGAFWKSRPKSHSPTRPRAEQPQTATPVSLQSLPPALQSLPLGETATIVWTGRPLTPAETAALARLAAPVIEFLSSRTADGAAEPARGAPRPPAARPEESEARR